MESRISTIRSHLESVRQHLHRTVSPLSNKNSITTPISVQTPNSYRHRHRHRSSSSRRAISATTSTRSTNQRVHHASPISSSPSTMSSSSHVSPRFDRHTLRRVHLRHDQSDDLDETTVDPSLKYLEMDGIHVPQYQTNRTVPMHHTTPTERKGSSLRASSSSPSSSFSSAGISNPSPTVTERTMQSKVQDRSSPHLPLVQLRREREVLAAHVGKLQETNQQLSEKNQKLTKEHMIELAELRSQLKHDLRKQMRSETRREEGTMSLILQETREEMR